MTRNPTIKEVFEYLQADKRRELFSEDSDGCFKVIDKEIVRFLSRNDKPLNLKLVYSLEYIIFRFPTILYTNYACTEKFEICEVEK